MFSSSSESNRNNNSTFNNNNNHNNLFQTQNHNLNPNQTDNNRLARFRSAPSSFFEALLDSAATDNNSSTSSGDESDANIFFSAFMNGPPLDLNQKDNNGIMKQEVIGVESELRPRGTGYESAVIVGGGAVVGSYDVRMESSTNTNQVRLKSSGNTSNLVRQSSSPAGFLNGFSVMGEVGNYKFHNHSEASSSASGLSNHHINFSSAPSSNLRFMPSIPEAGNSPEINGRLRNDNNTNGREFEASTFPHDSWTESPFNSLKRNREGDLKMFSTFNGLENQNGETRKSSSGLVHHMSLPNNYSEMGASEKVLQFQQDVVPCQIRAKRGFATHPRSIAERVRRTKISEKMKKLQDLFPDMDKQINTAEMLDLAVEFIKDLQKQVKTLTDTRAKCVCPNKPKESSHTT